MTILVCLPEPLWYQGRSKLIDFLFILSNSCSKSPSKALTTKRPTRAEISSSTSPRAKVSAAWARPEDDVSDEEEDALQDPPPHHYPDHLDWAERTQGQSFLCIPVRSCTVVFAQTCRQASMINTCFLKICDARKYIVAANFTIILWIGFCPISSPITTIMTL